MTEIVSLDPSSIGAAARTLAAAFSDDPVFRYMGRDRSGLGSRLHHGFAGMIRQELNRDGPLVFTTPDAGCAAIWHPVDGWKASLLDSVRVAPSFVRSFGLRVDRLLRVQQALEKAHPVEPHYHLAFIGTHPSRQGNGLGPKLMTVMTERCDREGVPAYHRDVALAPLTKSLRPTSGFAPANHHP